MKKLLFALFAILSGLTSFSQNALDYGRLPSHPRLFMRAGDEKAIKKMLKSKENRYLLESHYHCFDIADKALSSPVFKWPGEGHILSTSRNTLCRIINLCYAYRMTGSVAYAKRAEEELLNVCVTFPHWDPDHWLDTAEMMTAVAIGYDWLFDFLEDDARQDGVKQKQNLSVIKWDGTAVSQVGKAGFVDVSSNPVSYPISVKVNSKGNPVVMYSGGLVKGLISVMEFNGGNWNFIGTDQGVSQKFSVAYGTPQFYFNPKTGNPGFFYMCSTSKTDPNYRNYTEASYNGSDWSLDFGSLGDFPKYSDGSIFYMAAACNTKDVAWIVTSCNQKGYYVYKKTDSSWECVVNNFVPEGEPYGVPSNLSIKADADGNVYVFAAHSSAAKMQLYKVNEAGKSLDIYGNAFVCTPGSSGAIKDQASFDISEKGQFVAVVADKFYVLNADKQWEFANNLYMPGTLGKYSSYFMEFTGAESGVFTTTLDDAEGNTSICIYKFGPEE